MATQEILVVYKAEVAQLTAQLDKIAASQKAIIDGTEITNEATKKGLDAQELAARKRAQLIKLEEQEIKKLTQLRKLAYNPKIIEDYNNKIAISQKNIALLSKQSNQALSGVASSIKSIGSGIALGIGAAFSVDAIINFSKASVNAFLEAQKNAEKLKFAITQIGGESVAVFDKLIEQSKELQEITIFSDDSIQSAQAALSAFGLTGSEIEKLIPKLADFATVTQKSIEEAAQAVGQGLQGAGREFKKYGIEVSATASEQENLNKILDGFGQFAGAATNATKTLTGQLEQAKNQADELQESIGEKLAPSFVKARVAALEFAKDVVDFILNTDEAMRRLLKTMGLFPAEVAKTSDGFKAFTKEILAQVDAAQALGQVDQLAVKLRNDQTEAIAKQQQVVDRLNEAKEDALAREVVNLEEVRAIEEAIRKQQDTNLQNEITKLNIIEDILTKQRDLKKVEKEVSDARVAGSAKEVELLKLLGAEYNDLFTLLKDEQKTKLIELSVTAVTDPEAFKAEVARLAVELSNEIVVPIELKPRVDTGEFDDGIKKITEQEELLKDQQQQLLSESQSLLGSLTDLYRVYTDTRLQQISEELNAQLDALDIQEKEVQKNLDKRRISETEAERTTELLLKQRVEAEKRAADKEREIKRKQAILDKANALIQIIINTQQAASKAYAQGGILGPALAALIAVAGAAQAAVVVSQPIAYHKGSKDTGAKDHMALVGEEGPEYVMMPAHAKVLPAPQSKTYGEALEAMRRKQFDTYVSEKYVTPALVAQKKQDEKTRRKTFAENLAQSITYNTISQSTQKKLQDVSVTNVDALARGIARELKTDIYRR